MCEHQGRVTGGQLVNMPVYLIVSSRSVACNYIIMTERADTTDKLLICFVIAYKFTVLFICGHGN